MSKLQKSTPRDVFSHLLMTVSLYIAIVGTLIVLFQLINLAFPDPLASYAEGFRAAMRGGLAALIVAWPVFLGISWIIERDLSTGERNIRIRRWLLYLTLFLAAVTIMVDLITLINGFLEGELTARFGLKVVAVLVVAAAVFAYYLWDLRAQSGRKRTLRASAIASSVFVLASVVAGVAFAGSPAAQRAIRFDEQRVRDLQAIQSQVVDYYADKSTLPSDLDALAGSVSGFRAPADPRSGEAYEYAVGGDLAFTLCATFETERASTDRYPEPFGYGVTGGNWEHPAGRHCFDREIDPERLDDGQPRPLPAR